MSDHRTTLEYQRTFVNDPLDWIYQMIHFHRKLRDPIVLVEENELAFRHFSRC
ncbi:hypothetical protein HanPSC8_Chr01g0039281 [Helianthus annuus]|nr:hypothetical protein HanPSC8_Chr01g0039281 [Helianthus annuus]